MKKLYLALFIILTLLITPHLAGAITTYNATDLTGGSARDLDYLSVDDLANGDRAWVMMAGNQFLAFEYDSGASDAENVTTHPYKVRPDDFATTGVWIEQDTAPTVPGLYLRPKFSWKDADEIYIDAGLYYHNGTSEQLVSWSSQITFQLGSGGSNAASDDITAADTWHYIYIDDSAVVSAGTNILTASEFLNETTVSTKSQTKGGGYYNGSDLCIGAVRTDADGGDILEFFHGGGDFCSFADEVQDLAATDIDTVATDVTLSIPGFCTQAEVYIQTAYVDGAGSSHWKTKGQAGTTSHEIGYASASGTADGNTIKVITDSSQKIQVVMSAANGNTMRIETQGWYFPAGM